MNKGVEVTEEDKLFMKELEEKLKWVEYASYGFPLPYVMFMTLDDIIALQEEDEKEREVR